MDELEHLWPDPDKRDDGLDRLLARVNLPSEDEPPLSPTQARVLQAASHGLRDSEIGAVIGVTAQTAKTHLKRARRVLAAKNTTHACCEALRRGLIS